MYNWESIKEVISKIARSQKVDDNIPAPLRSSQIIVVYFIKRLLTVKVLHGVLNKQKQVEEMS